MPEITPEERLEWAVETWQRFQYSLRLLARQVEYEAAFQGVKAICGVSSLFSLQEKDSGARLMERLGFTVLQNPSPLGCLENSVRIYIPGSYYGHITRPSSPAIPSYGWSEPGSGCQLATLRDRLEKPKRQVRAAVKLADYKAISEGPRGICGDNNCEEIPFYRQAVRILRGNNAGSFRVTVIPGHLNKEAIFLWSIGIE